jgi:hypothetical protein
MFQRSVQLRTSMNVAVGIITAVVQLWCARPACLLMSRSCRLLQTTTERLSESRAALEKKAALYERLARGEVDDDGGFQGCKAVTGWLLPCSCWEAVLRTRCGKYAGAGLQQWWGC